MRQRAHGQQVDAGLRHLAGAGRVSPPLASRTTSGPTARARRHGLAQRRDVEVVEQDLGRAVGQRLVELGEGRRPRPAPPGGEREARPRTASSAAPTPPAAARWLSLTRTASWRPARWLRPPPQRTAYFSSERSSGIVLRVSRTRAPVPSTASAQARGRGGDPAEVAQQVQRGPLQREHRPGRGAQGRQRSARAHPVAVGGQQGESVLGAARVRRPAPRPPSPPARAARPPRPAARATQRTSSTASSGTVAAEVRSPAAPWGPRSSARVARTRRSTSSGSSPAAWSRPSCTAAGRRGQRPPPPCPRWPRQAVGAPTWAPGHAVGVRPDRGRVAPRSGRGPGGQRGSGRRGSRPRRARRGHHRAPPPARRGSPSRYAGSRPGGRGEAVGVADARRRGRSGRDAAGRPATPSGPGRGGRVLGVAHGRGRQLEGQAVREPGPEAPAPRAGCWRPAGWRRGGRWRRPRRRLGGRARRCAPHESMRIPPQR